DIAAGAAVSRLDRSGGRGERRGREAGCAIIAGTSLISLTRRQRGPTRASIGSHRFPIVLVAPSLTLYRRLLRYVRPYWWAFALAILGMVIVATGDVVMAYMVMPIIQRLQHPDPAMTIQLPLAVVAVFLLRGLGSFMSEYGMAWTGHRVVFDLRRQMIDRLLSLPTPYYDSQSSGRLISKFTFDAYQLA